MSSLLEKKVDRLTKKVEFVIYKIEIDYQVSRFIRLKKRLPKSLKELFNLKDFPKELKKNPITGKPISKNRQKKLLKL